MGSAAPLTPNDIAYTFAQLYYDVMQNIPKKLPGLYSADSELHHGKETAFGVEAITKVATALPLAGCRVNLFSLNVQELPAGLLVMVSGAVHEGSSFAQTFVLERPEGSHEAHLYVKRDVLSVFPKDEAAAKIEYEKKAKKFVRKDMQRTKKSAPQQAAVLARPNGVATKTDSPSSVVVATPKKISPQSSPMSEVAAAPKTQAAEAVVEEKAAVLPSDVTESTVAKTPSPESKPKKAAAAPAAKSAQPKQAKKDAAKQAGARNAFKAKPNAAAAPPKTAAKPAAEKPPAPPAPKTWASIVSKKPVTASPAAAPAADAPTSPPPATLTGPAQPPPAAAADVPPSGKKHEKAGGKPGGDKSGKKLGMVPAKANVAVPPAHPSAARPNGPPHGPPHATNGQHANGGFEPSQAHYKNRPFGPSAVVQLASMQGENRYSIKEMVHILKDEFGRYGHRVRHVEIKLPRGIAFVEYDTMDGVRAAVDAWARGPRDTGKLAGLPVDVSEKRTQFARRPGSVRGGGHPRGGTRGGMRGRRGRPASSPAS